MSLRSVLWSLLCCVSMVFASCHHPVPTTQAPSADPELASVDRLMWQQPDSALTRLIPWFDTEPATEYDRHYAHLLLAELLYKNDYEQTNRKDLLHAVDYFDSLADGRDASATMVFLDARAHYMNGVGYYERDSVVEACAQYLKAVEIMENNFDEKELTGQKAKLTALAYSHLTQLFSDQYLHEQAIYFAQRSIPYYKKHNATYWHIAWVWEIIGSHFDMLEQWDSASFYYNKALQALPDTNNLTFRDIKTGLVFLSYNTQKQPTAVLKQLHFLLAKSESVPEQLSRCLTIGDVYYHEQQYDSARNYLTKVFEESCSPGSKKQAAEWLVDIGKSQGINTESYVEFLLPFATHEENQSTVKSQLDEMYDAFRYKALKSEGNSVGYKTVCLIVAIIVGLTLLVLATVHSYRSNNKKTPDSETENPPIKLSPTAAWNRYEQFLNESVCKEIILSVQGKNIKRITHAQDFPELVLNDTQLQQLTLVINHYFGSFDTMLKQHGLSTYPSLVNLCHLYLLGMDDKQASVLLDRDYSSIKRSCKKLHSAFNTQENMAVFLRNIVLSS